MLAQQNLLTTSNFAFLGCSYGSRVQNCFAIPHHFSNMLASTTGSYVWFRNKDLQYDWNSLFLLLAFLPFYCSCGIKWSRTTTTIFSCVDPLSSNLIEMRSKICHKHLLQFMQCKKKARGKMFHLSFLWALLLMTYRTVNLFPAVSLHSKMQV